MTDTANYFTCSHVIFAMILLSTELNTIIAFNIKFTQRLTEEHGPRAAHRCVLINCSKALLFGTVVNAFCMGGGLEKRLCQLIEQGSIGKEQTVNILMPSMLSMPTIRIATYFPN